MMNKTKSPAFRLAKYFLILPLVLFLMTGNSVYAQQVDNVLMTADKEPQFPGGEREMMKFLAGNVRYPVLAQENHEQGRVVVNFIIEKDGSVSGIAIAQGATTRLDAEAVRVLTAMPKWTPAEHDGEAARFRYTMPFVFRLQGDNIPASTTPASKHPKTSETGKLLDEVVIVGYGSSGG